MPSRFRTAALRPLLLLPLLGCDPAPLSNPFVSVSEAIIGGELDTRDPSVVMVLMRGGTAGPGVRFVCTGAVVAPHVVLTAAHCLDPKLTGDGEYGVFAGSDLNDPDQASDSARFFTAKETHRHPSWASTNPPPAGGSDVGVIITSKAMTAPPLAMNRAPLGPEAVGASLRLIGAGRRVAADADSHGTLVQVSSEVRQVLPEHLVFEEEGVSLTCHGDSGGPAVGTWQGGDVIVGIHSYGEHQSCTGKNYEQRIDLYAAAFVDPLIAKADPAFTPALAMVSFTKTEGADAGVEAPPPGASKDDDGCTVRSPGRQGGETSLALLPLALAAAVLRRRRSS